MAWQHRPALDGLRTVAVYLVLCFHAGVGWASGGFVGVDLFFVLSGFLVASILLEERYTTGTIALASFFARRVRRLLPAAVLTVVVTSLVFLLVAPVVRRLDWVGDAQSALLYVANWRFLHTADDYFAADSAKSPFLHFWSLAVEEQFYVAFPFVLLGLVALKKWWRPALVVGIASLLTASVIAQVWWAQTDELHAYYGTDARIYQPLAGVLAAIAWRHLATRRRALRRAGWPMLIGLVVVGSSLVDVSQSNRGLLATVFATGLILAVMTRTTPSLNAALGVRQMTYLGRISYGTYLWHWPVLLLVVAGLDTPAWVDALLTAAIATGLAAISYELLEHPVRRSALLARFNGSTVLIGLTCSALVAFVVAPAVLKNDVRPALLAAAPPQVTTTPAPGAPTQARAGEIAKPTDAVPGIDWEAIHASRGAETAYCTSADTSSCIAHVGKSDLHVMLVGDSHARVLAPTMLKIAQERDFTLSYSMVASCPWQEGVISSFATPEEQADCRIARSELYDEDLLTTMGVDVVVLTEMPRSSEAWQQGLLSTQGSTADVDQLNLETITSTLQKIKQADAKALAIDAWLIRTDDVNPLECLSGARTVGECAFTAPPAPLTDAFVHTFDTRQADIASVGINDIVCPTYPVCQAVLGDLPVWRDPRHYSTEVLLAHVDQIRDRLVATGFLG